MRMKRPVPTVIIFVLLLIGICAYVIFVPPLSGTLGPVAVSLRGFRTNGSGQVAALVAISNQGPLALDFYTGTEIREASGWTDSSGIAHTRTRSRDPDPTLTPGNERVVSVLAPSTIDSWRVVVE